MSGSRKEYGQSATEYMLILAAALVVVAVAAYYVTRGPSFPPLSATATHVDNEIRVNIDTGSISAGDWQYSVSTIYGTYDWKNEDVELKAPYASLGTYSPNNYYVSLKHQPSGHIYFSDQTITIT